METELRIAGVIEESIADGPGFRFVVFAQGCKHQCPGCHNPHTHAMDGGYLTTVEDILKQMKKNPLLDGITLSGGDPFEQSEAFGQLAKLAKEAGYHVMTYTGYTYEQLTRQGNNLGWGNLLNHTDILVDGPYRENQNNGLLRFRGSENQRMIHIPCSIAQNTIVLAV